MDLSAIQNDLLEAPDISWQQLPDLDLYLDQVITYLSREQIPGCQEAELTPSMVNNYVKEKLLPRAVGKKYQREHLVYLRMINALKQVYNVKEIKVLLDLFSSDKSPEAMFVSYLSSLEAAMAQVSQDLGRGEQADLAFRLAVQAYVYKMVSQRLLSHNETAK